MFGEISARYDFFNKLVSLGLHSFWRKYFLKSVFKAENVVTGVDLGTGTGDVILGAIKINSSCLWTGIDVSAKMLDCFRAKLRKSHISERSVSLFHASSDRIPVRSSSQDVVTSAFVIRNIALILRDSLLESYRILKKGGRVVFIDLYKPNGLIFGRLYRIYSCLILPFVAKCLFKSSSSGFYLYNSIHRCPNFVSVENMMKSIGFYNVSHQFLFCNSLIIYSAKK